MNDQKSSRKRRILMTEGASTSAREAVTALGLRGHHIEICDSDPRCLSRFSKFVRRYHRCPPLATDPVGYMRFVRDLVQSGQFDVLLPIHEQGLAIAKIADQLGSVGLALPSFDAYATALDKARFSRLLTDVGVAQPQTWIVKSADDIPADATFPLVLKLPVATAHRGVWMVDNDAELAAALTEIGRPAEGFLVQRRLQGPLEHAQTVFDRGRFLGMHAYRQILAGAGGGEALKESIARPDVRADMEKVAARLQWHGALSVDYILHDGKAHYFDCNPRLVEPMSGVLAGVDLADLLVRLSLGETLNAAPPSRAGVRTRLAMQGLLGAAKRTNSRLSVLRECYRLIAVTGPYAGTREELTPVRQDWLSLVPLTVTLLALLASPRLAEVLPKAGWGAGLLTDETVAKIEASVI